MLPSYWPKWTLFFIALALVVGIVVAALILVPIGKALSPTATPEPDLAAVNYARPLSTECEACHTDREALTASGAPADQIEALYIEPASLETIHGSLGCITCHGGSGETADKDAAHEGLILDLSETHPEDCLLCHRNLPDQFPDDNLRTPHGQVTNAVWEGSACGVLCSDCHGEVGHGFDPVSGETICPMTVCLDCHQERNLDASMSSCEGCHISPHDISSEMTCEDCHPETDTWQVDAFDQHTEELVGEHADLDCFTCHRWPNFGGLDYGCSNCHERPHEQGNDDCALCHSPEGWEASAAVVVAKATNYPHPVDGDQDCLECHAAGKAYAMPDDHAGRVNDDCQVCHTPEPAPALMHPIADRHFCLDCHDTDQAAPFPRPSHEGYDEEICSACHVPADIEPMAVPHSLEGRSDCLMCHGPVRVVPFPKSHTDWGNDLCLLCHEADQTPTKTVHSFPTDHNGAGENCTLCHPRQDFTTYTCEACHVQATVEVIHVERGIKLEDDCTICHPEGKKLLSSD